MIEVCNLVELRLTNHNMVHNQWQVFDQAMSFILFVTLSLFCAQFKIFLILMVFHSNIKFCYMHRFIFWINGT